MTRVIAHRGASADYPENTREAFRGAVAQGADLVELDVRLLADGATVVCHDAVLADGRVIATLRAEDLPAGMPDLNSALRACEPLGVNVEIKAIPFEPGYDPDLVLVDVVVAALERRVPSQEILISSFHPGALERFAERAPSSPRAFLAWGRPAGPELVERSLGLGCVAVHPFDPEVSEEFVAAAHAAGLEVNVWTVNEPERMVELALWGVDGLITDRPGECRRVLDSMATPGDPETPGSGPRGGAREG